MGRVKKLWNLRRQNDKVKLALWMFLLAGWFAVEMIGQVGEYAVLANKPVEYILKAQVSGSLLNTKIKGLHSMEGVIGVSKQREYVLIGEKMTLTVTELSEEYLAQCYGIRLEGAGQQYWLSPEAFQELTDSKSRSPVYMAYERDGKRESGGFSAAAGVPVGEGRAVSTGNSLTLSDSDMLRIRLEHYDQILIGSLEGQGFIICNQEDLLAQTYETELLLVKFRYQCIAAALALVAGWALVVLGKKEVLASNG